LFPLIGIFEGMVKEDQKATDFWQIFFHSKENID